jgi:protein-S-isoprenylcysteine O-methyltransferase Ste14
VNEYIIMQTAMIQNMLAVAGFLLLAMADIMAVRGSRRTFAVAMPGYGLVGAAMGLFLLPVQRTQGHAGNTQALPATLDFLFISVAATAAGFLFWTVFFEPSAERRKRKIPPGAVISTGSYGLCRHPGFWWFSIIVVLLGARNLAKGAAFLPAFITIFIMITADLLLILMQDCYTFPRILGGYDTYRKAVPFLVPQMPHRRKARQT